MTRKPPASLYQMSKCALTHGSVSHIDVNQPPSKGKPWENIKKLNQINQVDLLVPDDCYQTIRTELQGLEIPKYLLADAKLEDVMEKKFLNDHIKTGNVSILSKGDSFSGIVFKVDKGILSIYVDKETFERSGLEGKEDTQNGSRSLKSRWVITYDLTINSMQHGKRGFDRLLYACKNVFNYTVKILLFYKPHAQDNPQESVLPTAKMLEAQPVVTKLGLSRQPSLRIGDKVEPRISKEDTEEYATDIYEWISLARLQSPRIASSDNIDGYLSKYQVPNDPQLDMELWRIRWSGFIDPNWLRNILIGLEKGCPSQSWFSLTALGFGQGLTQAGAEITIMRPPEAVDEFLMWEID